MWIIKWVVGAILIILVIGFAMQNMDQQVSVAFLSWQSVNLPLWVVMYVSFALGILFWLVVSIFQILSLKSDNRKSRKQIKKLKEELDRLRNVAVEESVLPAKKPVKAEPENQSNEE